MRCVPGGAALDGTQISMSRKKMSAPEDGLPWTWMRQRCWMSVCFPPACRDPFASPGGASRAVALNPLLGRTASLAGVCRWRFAVALARFCRSNSHCCPGMGSSGSGRGGKVPASPAEQERAPGGLREAGSFPPAQLFAESRSVGARSQMLEIIAFSNRYISLRLSGI